MIFGLIRTGEGGKIKQPPILENMMWKQVRIKLGNLLKVVAQFQPLLVRHNFVTDVNTYQVTCILHIYTLKVRHWLSIVSNHFPSCHNKYECVSLAFDGF